MTYLSAELLTKSLAKLYSLETILIRSLHCYKNPEGEVTIFCTLTDVDPAETTDIYGVTFDEMGICSTDSDDFECAQEDLEQAYGVDSEEALEAETMKVVTAGDPNLPEEIKAKIAVLAEELDREIYSTFDNPLTQIFINVRNSASFKLKDIEPLAKKILVNN